MINIGGTTIQIGIQIGLAAEEKIIFTVRSKMHGLETQISRAELGALAAYVQTQSQNIDRHLRAQKERT